MTGLASLHPDCNVAVIGASGGIGRAFVDLLSQDDRVARVFAYSRSNVSWEQQNVVGNCLDVTDEASIATACQQLPGDAPLDLVLVASGVLHNGARIRPEKSMRALQSDSLAEVFAVNAIGPALLAKHLLPRQRRGHKTVFAAMSARVGSIADNRLGGWAAYRMSKAALNMLIRTLAIEQARLSPASVVIALHPGTVDTALSKPFSARVEPAALQSPKLAASRLLQTIDRLTPGDSGGFFANDGTPIDF